ncbi:NAD(P)H-dependent oxidoreductase [Helicobacter mustelae]|uniref:Putative NAD(P)H oxidoreductase n=1 Tax=Helicobacter mustelae (strain ATCC 43772 / CCUG 25715 / CIP 103759 / LMG 18044 / NCTC 12198 / R85-136P) TaxID=679897 RepID=D3UIG1_HELM1|nr:NAD(P)H-dependent oxidoreductase [Helicobacter mustelae]CBG40284.1 putative NAD(P)H oxidoreductase [Helicobacter mustelae 12198]SQH71784.1 NAD(P)H oxidoreductase [Helicobacter mustelae]STP12913.1 NAD(P)H oxidoreductase [Helicobacter mustelae]
MQTLLIFGHTFFQDSKVNKALLESLKELTHIKVHNLTTTYPDGKIDVNKELELLRDADKIVFQFPLFWYGSPAILKQWQDVVLSAVLFGENPKFLHGKKFQIITTLGGAESTYDGHHGATLKDLLLPISYSFQYGGCEILEPFAIFSAKVENLDFSAYHRHLGE